MPEVRIVLHAGPVVAGECGDAKLSIVYLGDTLNTAARIEETAKTLGHDVLISDDLLARLDLPPSLRADPLGATAARPRAADRAPRAPTRGDHGRRRRMRTSGGSRPIGPSAPRDICLRIRHLRREAVR